MTIRKLIIALLMTILPLSPAVAKTEFDPIANKDAQIIKGNARFTVLTPRLIRMEWADDGKFEDNATLGIINRNLEVPSFSTSCKKDKLVIKTSELTLTYIGNEKFSESNLQIEFKMADSKCKKGEKHVRWHPGMDDSANLLGTARTLDKFEGDVTIDPYDKGVVSRDGWAIIDESNRHLFVPVESDWKYWTECRPEGDRLDLYFFGYGHDYTQAIKDFTKIAGRIPLPPKYTFGYWWCRYWEYSDFELIDLAEHFRQFNIPMDVMIIDMDWHETWNELYRNTPPRYEGGQAGRDEFGQRIGWTGYTWKKDLFPNPENFIKELHDRKIRTSLNLHFNNGIQPYEEPYDKFVKDYLSRTDVYDGPDGYIYTDKPYIFEGNTLSFAKKGEKAPVPYRMSQIEWADAYFNSIIRPLDKQGVDFWWLDWQQWIDSRYVKGLSNTFWLNYTFFTDKIRQSEFLGDKAPRPMIYHRWGGIGSHRYQVGFSGDTYATWKVLGGLPYFTSTASNVGYGYWGHDIGGHMQPKGVSATDPELYTRWLQSGVFTPIFKTHSGKDMTMEKRFWVFPDYFDPMREAIRLRYDLSPYIYNAARQAYDTGVSICRPLYYYWPEDERAYTWKEEFMFGDDILATTVCQPVDKTTGLAERTMWFPCGQDWYDMSTGTMYKGGSQHNLLYTINENPYYVKAGAIIPMASPDIMTLQEQNPNIVLTVIPGLGESCAQIYEDDGESQSYDTDFATTEIRKITTNNEIQLNILPRKGNFDGMLSNRKICVVLEGMLAPVKITINGTEIPYSRMAATESKQGKQVWGYDGNELQCKIWLAESPATEKLEVVCTYDRSLENDIALLSGKKGLIKRIMSLTPDAKYWFSMLKIKGFQTPSEFIRIAQCGSFINEDPYNAEKYLKQLDTDAMVRNLNSWEKLNNDFKTKVTTQTHFEKQ